MKWTEKRQYDTLEVGLCRHLHRMRVEGIIKAIHAAKRAAKHPLQVLDVGCGDAVITKRLRDAFPHEAIEGVDLDEVRLARARAYCPGVTFRIGDVAALPYESGRFDLVLCHHVVEHVPEAARVVAECHRVLVPGGTLILGIPHEGGLIGRILRRMHRRLYEEGEHINFYTIPEMVERIRRQGFTDVTYAKFGFLFPNYYVHMALASFRPTFLLGHWISQRLDITADSLIFVGRKGLPASAGVPSGSSLVGCRNGQGVSSDG